MYLKRKGQKNLSAGNASAIVIYSSLTGSKNSVRKSGDSPVSRSAIACGGMPGSPTRVFRIQSIVLKKEGFTAIEPSQEGIKKLVHELVSDRILG